MIAYLDTNVYIGAKYQFSNDKFSTLRSLISEGDVRVIYSSATRGEVEQHIRDDIKDGVNQYNRVLRKELLPLMSISQFSLCAVNEEDAARAVFENLSEFFSLDGVEQIDLNPLDAEQLMSDYFQGNLPFESKKPYEFKDAIMINAVKQYQQRVQETIIVVSDDEGFRKAFDGLSSFVTVKYLGDLIKLCRERKDEYSNIEACLRAAVENDEFYDIIQNHFAGFDVDRGYYGEWECEEYEIDSMDAELAYIEYVDGKYRAHIDVVLYLVAEITHRDEDTSYFDREEQRYLIENYVTWREKHRVKMDIVIACSIEKGEADEYEIADSLVIDNRKFRTLDLDESTMQGWDELETECREEPDLIYCSECGKVLGYSAEYTDYDDNPLCGDCMVSNSRGDICPACGRKIPHEFMISGFCKDCFKAQD